MPSSAVDHSLEAKRLELALNAARLGEFEWDIEQDLLRVSERMAAITGLPAGALKGGGGDAIYSFVHLEDRAAVRAAVEESLRAEGRYEAEFRLAGEPGRPDLWLRSSGDVVRNEGGKPQAICGVIQDITQRKALEEQLRLLALTDHLTGLCNRNGFKTALSKSLERNKRTNKHIALLFIDLDHFKQVNDTLGHDAGDALLQSVAAELKACVRSNDTVARLGGDEFTVILEDLEAPEDCALIARKILAALRQPFHLNGNGMDILVSASIGIATHPGCGNDPGSLMQAADVAMYRAKTDGRNGYQFFTPEMNAKAEARLMLEQSLRKALDQRELSLYYQAQIDIRDNRIVGLEALMRWQHPEAGLVSPAVFVPLLEETGLIMSVGPWVIEEACAQRARWRESGLLTDDCHLAINISARQFRDHSLLAELRRCLNKYGLAPGMIEIELTEGSLMQDTDLARRILSELRRMGIGLAVDDFGTGYSSLSYLKQFELDVLKIDKSFVEQITENPKDAALAASIIALAHNLGLGVVAEGVETEDEAQIARDAGVDMLQGYLIGRPHGELSEGRLPLAANA